MLQNRGIKCIIIIIIIFIAVISSHYYIGNLCNVMNSKCKFDFVKNNIMSRSVYNKHIPDINENANDVGYIIYILGGSQDTLINTYKYAAELYKHNISKYIFILDRPSNKKYYPIMNKYFTNNEWSVNELEKHGVKKQIIKFVSIPNRIFGTLTEAEEMSKTAAKYGYNNIILVTSEYHTKRAFKSFSYFSKEYNFEVFVYGSKDDIGIKECFIEYMKHLFYEYCLL